MHVALLLLWIVLAYGEEDFVLNRLRIVKNPSKQVSVRFHTISADTALIHAALRFSSPINEQHTALLIEKSSAPKYRKIMREEPAKMILSSRGTKKMLAYHTIQDSTVNDANSDGVNDRLYDLIQSMRLFGMSVETTYDAVLLMDEYSAIWNQHNVMLFERDLLTLQYRAGPLRDTTTSVSDLQRLVPITCDPNFDSDHCLMLGESLSVNDHAYPNYRILIDLDSSLNLLPINLFGRWYAQRDQTLTLQWFDASLNQTLLLPLDHHLFQYEMHQSNMIVLGVDMLHNFPKLEYSVSEKQFQIYYFWAEQTQADAHQAVEVFFVFLVYTVVYCFFRWATSYNYMILNYLVQFGNYAKTAHYFAVKQVIYEGVAIVVSVIASVTSLFFVNLDTETPEQNRQLLFIFFSLYHVIILLLILFMYVEPFRATLLHYFRPLYTILYRKTTNKAKKAIILNESPPQASLIQKQQMQAMSFLQNNNKTQLKLRSNTKASVCGEVVEVVVAPANVEGTPLLDNPYCKVFADITSPCDREALHNTVVKMYHDPIIKLYTPISIIRNLAFVTVLLVAWMLIFNFYTTRNNIYLLLIMALSFALIYYQVKYITLGILYLSLFHCEAQSSRANQLLVCFLVVETLVSLLYIILSYNSIYVAYFNSINSAHPPSTINAYVLSLITVLVLAGVFMVSMAYDKWADKIIDDTIECRQRRCREYTLAHKLQ